MLKSSTTDPGPAVDSGEDRGAWMERLQELIYRDFKGSLDREMVRRQREGWLFAEPQLVDPSKAPFSSRSFVDQGYSLSMVLTDPIEMERAWPALMREGQAYRQSLQRMLTELGQVDRTIRALRTQIGSNLLSTSDRAIAEEWDHVMETFAKERWEWKSQQEVVRWAKERTELRELRSWLAQRQEALQDRLSNLESKMQFERAQLQKDGAGTQEAGTKDGSLWDRLLSAVERRMELQEALQAMREKGIKLEWHWPLVKSMARTGIKEARVNNSKYSIEISSPAQTIDWYSRFERIERTTDGRALLKGNPSRRSGSKRWSFHFKRYSLLIARISSPFGNDAPSTVEVGGSS